MIKQKKKRKKRKGWADHLLTSQLTQISEIYADQQMQQRARLNNEALSEYENVLADGGELPAIKCVRDDAGTLWLWDGFHTLEAAKRAGLSEIRVEVSSGTKRDAWLKSLGANAKHGIRRSRADRQKAIDSALSDPEIKMSLLKGDREHSFRSIAKLCAVDHKTVSKRWNENHLPGLMRGTDEKLSSEWPAESTISEEAWLMAVASDLGLPLSWVRGRWEIVQEEAERNEELKSKAGRQARGEFPTNSAGSQEDPKSGEFPTNSAGSAHGYANQEDPKSGEFPTNSAGSAHGYANQEDLKSKAGRHARGEFPTNSAGSQEDLKSKAGRHARGEFPTNSAGSPRHVEPSAEIISAPQPVPTVIVWPSNVTIHDPTRGQLYDGDQLSPLLANYASKQCGVQVVEAQRPSDGWTKETSQGINQALAQVTNQGTENVKSVLIMIVKD